MSDAASLALILPAFDEEARLGPALDELFGYLGRRGEHARDGAPGAADLPATIDVLVVDDGSTDGTAALVAGPPGGQRSAARPARPSRLLTVPHGGKGAAVRAGMLAARRRPHRLRRRRHGDAARPAAAARRALADHDVALGSRIQPDGSDMRTSQPVYRRALGKVFHLLASIWVVGPVQDTQCGFKGFRRAAAHDLFEAPADPQHRLRRRAHLPRPPARLPDRDRARSAGRTGAARACARGRDWRCASPGTSFRIPLLHRGVRRIGT